MGDDPQLGILQPPLVQVNRTTLFGRVQQFAARVHGPMCATGLAYWTQSAAPYWGHNAIIRITPFVRHCRLPVLSGRPGA